MATINQTEIIDNAKGVIERAGSLQGLVTHKAWRELELIIEAKEQDLLDKIYKQEGVSEFERGEVAGLKDLVDEIFSYIDAGEIETQTLNKL